jgi:DNA-binding NarL/FixJ family response regulator
MDAALESVFERMPKWEAESERKFLARTRKKIGIDEGKRIGLISERKSVVRKLRQKGHTPEGIADLLDLSVDEVVVLLKD